ncbi:hypothetical protein U1Q18_030109 [Sarracenia purpurea var. burkii]
MPPMVDRNMGGVCRGGVSGGGVVFEHRDVDAGTVVGDGGGAGAAAALVMAWGFRTVGLIFVQRLQVQLEIK